MQAIIVLIGVTLITFVMTKMVPGGLCAAELGIKATPANCLIFNHQNGLDRPFFVQYWDTIWGYFHLNFGYSPKLDMPVSTAIGNALPNTLVLLGLALLVTIIIAVPLGVFQVMRRNKPSDYVLTGFTFFLYAMPTFLFGELVIMWFAVGEPFKLLPPAGPSGSTVPEILSQPRAMILPVFTLAFATIASFSRYMRSSMMDALTEDYVRTAKAKGASNNRVLFRHALRNALIPLITLIGLSLPAIVGGAVITEDIFNYKGMGELTVQSISNDEPYTLLGVTIVATIATVIGNLLADVFYAVADPRIRYASK